MGRKRNVRRRAKQLGIKRSAAGNLVKTVVHTKPAEAPPIDNTKSASDDIDFEEFQSAVERQRAWEERMFRNPVLDAIERQERMFRNPLLDAIEKQQRMFRDPITETLKHSVVDRIANDSVTSQIANTTEQLRKATETSRTLTANVDHLRQAVEPLLKLTEPLRTLRDSFRPFKR